MLTTIIRTFILYTLLTIMIRLMGKRQIGQLQPGELVITIMISEIAVTPIQDIDIPILPTIIALLLLVTFEMIMSFISLKSVEFRTAIQGSSLIIIRNGILDQSQIKRLRFTVDDIMEALRKKNIFRIEQVQYAIAETDGTLSVLLKPEYRTITAQDMNKNILDDGMPCVVISDGKIIESDFKECGMDNDKLNIILRKINKSPKDIMVMTIDKQGNTNVIDKET